MKRRIECIEIAFPGEPALDTAFSRVFLDRVARGDSPETMRLYRPDDVVAFSGVDAASAGFARAVAAARAAGFDAVLRLAGGRAAVFHRETLAFAWSIPAAESRDAIHPRFAELAELVAAALARLGVDARVGEVPGEYCPGEYSVNARGVKKLMGVGQRVIRGAAHVGGVIVVGGSERVRAALEPVYDAMGFPWTPDTTGSVADEIGAVAVDDVRAALVAELGTRFELLRVAPDLDAAVVEARALAPRFAVDATAAGSGHARGKVARESA